MDSRALGIIVARGIGVLCIVYSISYFHSALQVRVSMASEYELKYSAPGLIAGTLLLLFALLLFANAHRFGPELPQGAATSSLDRAYYTNLGLLFIGVYLLVSETGAGLNVYLYNRLLQSSEILRDWEKPWFGNALVALVGLGLIYWNGTAIIRRRIQDSPSRDDM